MVTSLPLAWKRPAGSELSVSGDREGGDGVHPELPRSGVLVVLLLRGGGGGQFRSVLLSPDSAKLSISRRDGGSFCLHRPRSLVFQMTAIPIATPTKAKTTEMGISKLRESVKKLNN